MPTLLKESKASYGLTAFLDILGFGAQVSCAKDGEDLEAILEGVSLIRDAFDFRPEDKATKKLRRAYKKTVLAFSDSVIVNLPLASEMTALQGTFDALMGELHSIAVAQARCVENGLFMRGGVDLNWWYRDGKVLVSKGLVHAYALETSACVPVIAVTDEVYRFFSEHRGRQDYASDFDPFPGLMRRFTGQVSGAAVDIHYLDYISMFAGEIGWTPTKANHKTLLSLPSDQRGDLMEKWRMENVIYWLSGHARMIELAHCRSSVRSVQAKYEWLANYHNEIAPHWTGDDPSCRCVLA